MTASYPSGLPEEHVQGTFKLTKPYRDPLATDMEDGPQATANQTTVEIATVQFSRSFTAAEFATWKSFVRDTLGHGSLQFTMPVWTGSAYETKTCKLIGGTYQDEPDAIGKFHTVSATFDVWDY